MSMRTMRTYSFYVCQRDRDLIPFFDELASKLELSQWVCKHGRVDISQDRQYIIKKREELENEIIRLENAEKKLILENERRRFEKVNNAMHSNGEMQQLRPKQPEKAL